MAQELGHAERAKARRSKARLVNCVTVRQETRDRGVDLVFKSRCRGLMRCTISWRLRCTGDRRGSASSEEITLAAASSETQHLSAKSCGDKGWEIRDVRWSYKSAE
jgi:hypothetical protein